jgi:hypothetical protein
MALVNFRDVQSRFPKKHAGDIAILNMKISVLLVALFSFAGCANLVSGLTSKMADDLAYTILNSDDLETVREGVPAYLLLIDSFLHSDPENENLLLAASSLNGSYSIFADEERAKLLTAKSFSYALKAACIASERLCNFRSLEFQKFRRITDDLRMDDLPVAYAVGVAWTGWIQANSGDWNAIAELAKVRYLMERKSDYPVSRGAVHLERIYDPCRQGPLQQGIVRTAPADGGPIRQNIRSWRSEGKIFTPPR